MPVRDSLAAAATGETFLREDAWLIVASAAGSARNPPWYHNLAAHPDQVWIELPPAHPSGDA